MTILLLILVFFLCYAFLFAKKVFGEIHLYPKKRLNGKPARIVFVHPDLGIGGAERLVVDAALALLSKGHQVHIVTSYHDPNRCFPETADGIIPVTVSGGWIPRSLFGGCLALCAYLRMMWAALYVSLSDNPELKADVYFCDQVSVSISVLKLFSKTPVLFYCHFPDQLLSSRGSWIQRMYRRPLDWLEEKTTGLATTVVVNSLFTAGIFRETFKSLSVRPQVLYPSLNFEAFDQLEPKCADSPKNSFIFLSINRYERKKNLAMALESFSEVKSRLGSSANPPVHLIMAGGYDERLLENVTYRKELEDLRVERNLDDKSVTMLCSPDDCKKTALLHGADVLIYTPDKEHFGIVPLEAMYCRLPVIAVASGGPLETVEDGRTGFLCNQSEKTAKDFANKMIYFYENRERAVEMGKQGRQRVKENFSFNHFCVQLDGLVTSLLTLN